MIGPNEAAITVLFSVGLGVRLIDEGVGMLHGMLQGMSAGVDLICMEQLARTRVVSLHSILGSLLRMMMVRRRGHKRKLSLLMFVNDGDVIGSE